MFRLVLLVLIVSCGTQNKDSQSKALAPVIKTAVAAPSQEEASTLYLDTIAQMPNCNHDNDRELVYVKETAQFSYCEAGASKWVHVEIRSKEVPSTTATDSVIATDTSSHEIVIAAKTMTVTVPKTQIQTDTSSDGASTVITLPEDSHPWVNPDNNITWFLAASFSEVDLTTQDIALCPDGSSSVTEPLFQSVFMQLSTQFAGIAEYVWLYQDKGSMNGIRLHIGGVHEDYFGEKTMQAASDPNASSAIYRAMCVIYP